jgi:hypothetical protein
VYKSTDIHHPKKTSKFGRNSCMFDFQVLSKTLYKNCVHRDGCHVIQVIFLIIFSWIILFDLFSRSSITDVFSFGLLNNFHIRGVFFCNIAVIYQTLFFSV